MFVSLLTLLGLAAMMLAMGMQVTMSQIVDSCRMPRLMTSTIAANFLLVPVVTVALLRLFDAHPMVSAGFLILAVCPGAPLGPPFTAISRGDVSLSIGLMVILGALCTVTAPLLLRILLPQFLTAVDLRIDYAAIVWTLLIAQMLPLGVGLALRHRFPRLSDRIEPPVRSAANLILVVVVALLLSGHWKVLQLIRLRGWVGMFLLLTASLGIGWLCGGPGVASRKSIALTTAVRNAAVALVIVTASFQNTPAVTAVVAYALFSTFAALAVAFALSATTR